MKYLFAVVILCAAIGLSQQALTKEKIEEMLMKLVSDCSKREGATPQDVGQIITRNPPINKEQKCLSACIGESIGLIKDGKTDVAMTEKLAKNAFGADDPRVAIAVDMAKECVAITDPDRCESAAKMYACGRAAAEKRNLKFEDFM